MRVAALLLVAFLFLPACGSGGQDRPVLVESFPAPGEILTSPLGAVRLTYDDFVTILNPANAEMFADGARINVTLVQSLAQPCCVFVIPTDTGFFANNATLSVFIERGAVINTKNHYAEEAFTFSFITGNMPSYLGRGSVVTPIDDLFLTIGNDIPTPGGRTAVGIQGVAPNDQRQVYVQLADGGGAREAMARFPPGTGAMAPIQLSTSTGAGDLTATARAIATDSFGRWIFAAYRDETNSTVRVHRINLTTMQEDGALQLSIPAGPSTRPLGMTRDPRVNQLFVSCDDGANGRQAYIDIESFTEVDRDPTMPGIQSFFLPDGAGPITDVEDQAVIVPAATNMATFTRTSSNSSAVYPVAAVGTSVDVMRTADFEVVVQPLTGYADQMGIVTRTETNGYLDPALLTISDDAGAGPTGATTVRAMAPTLTDNRFLGVLDTEVLVRWFWTGVGFDQEDLNAEVPGIQGVDLSTIAPGVTTIGRTQGAFPTSP